MKKFINPLLRLGTAVALLSVIYMQNKELRKYRSETPVIPKQDSLQVVVDSLSDELFNEKTQTGRYELSLEHLYEVNPKAAKQFENYMNNETE
jgi:hypothetical protein